MLISKTYCNITIFVQCTWKHIPNIDYHLKKLKDVKAIIESLCWNVEYPLKLSTTQTPLIHMFLLFLQVSREGAQSIKNLMIWGQILFKGEGMMQSYPARALDRRLQLDWARDPRKVPRVLMSLRVYFDPMG